MNNKNTESTVGAVNILQKEAAVALYAIRFNALIALENHLRTLVPNDDYTELPATGHDFQYSISPAMYLGPNGQATGVIDEETTPRK